METRCRQLRWRFFSLAVRERRRLPKERSRWSRMVFNETLLACFGVVVVVGLFVIGGLALDWWVYHDRYGIGFVDYLRTFVL